MNLGKYKVAIIGILFGVSYWIVESLLHTFIFIDEPNLFRNLFAPSIHEIVMRVVVFCLLIISTFFFHLFYSRIHESRQKLRESEQNYREAYNRADYYRDIVIHDMGNVLHNVHSSVDLILKSDNEYEYSKNFEELLIIMQNSCKKGTKLISNVRKLSKLENAELFNQAINITKQLNDSIKFLHQSFKDKEIIIQLNEPNKKFFVRANELLLDVFENLLNNAVKYNENSIIYISVKILKEKQRDVNYIRLEFIDNGIGIRDEIKEGIFLKEFQKDNQFRGLGIGLSLVKKIIESYEGKIWVEDKVKGEYSKGSNFIVLIPELI